MSSLVLQNEAKADSDQLALLINEASAEWDRDCKEAYELGFFDMDRGTFIVGRVNDVAKKVAKNNHPAVPFLTSQKVEMFAMELDDIAKYHGGYDYGLPAWSENFLEDLRGMLKKLWDKK